MYKSITSSFLLDVFLHVQDYPIIVCFCHRWSYWAHSGFSYMLFADDIVLMDERKN